jgi:Peptidase family M23
MSWEDIMRRVLPPIEGIPPHTTSPYGARQNRPPSSTNPHGGVDFDYIGGKYAVLNRTHPEIHSPVAGTVTNAGEGTVGKIAIRDANGFSHEILHTQTRHVAVGDGVAAGQVIGTMGNTGVERANLEKGDQHVHYQLKDPTGIVIDPSAFWDRQGQVDTNPAPPIPPFVAPSDVSASPDAGQNTRRLGRRIAGKPEASGQASTLTVTPNEIVSPNGPASFGDRFGSWSSPVLRALEKYRGSAVPDGPASTSVQETPPATPAVRAPMPNSPSALPSDRQASFGDRFGAWTSSPAGISPRNPDQPAQPPEIGGTPDIFSGKPVRYLSGAYNNNLPASVSDTGAPAAQFVLPDSLESSGGLAGRIAALAGIDPQNPDQPAPSPLDAALRGFYNDDPAQPWFVRAR